MNGFVGSGVSPGGTVFLVSAVVTLVMARPSRC